MPMPVRALWQAASEEERTLAHTTASAILRTWLGKASREEVANELSLSAVRVWQLSQQAVCGLVVGCLRQPRFRGRPPQRLSEAGVSELKKKIASLERELDASKRLIELLRAMPARSGEAIPPSGEVAVGATGGRQRGGRRPASADAGPGGGAGKEPRHEAR
jgi:hypothetical protein